VTLKLVIGPANAAKAGEVLGAYAAAAPRGALLVVPTAQDVRHYQRELATRADAGGAGAGLGEILTFDGLVAVIAERAGAAVARLSALQRSRVLATVIQRLRRDGLDALHASARGAGFARAAGELVAELERSLITPQRFTAALRAWAAQDVRRVPFTRDLSRLYSAYGRELERLGRVDRELFAWRALDALRQHSGAGASAWGRDAVFVYGFDDLTGLERDAVETLTRLPGVEVTVSLTYEPGHPALVARAETVEALRPLAAEVVALDASDTYYAPGSREVLHRLERDLFSDAPSRGDGGRSELDPGGEVVTLLESGGERAEAELVAAEILRLHRVGLAWEEMVVVSRSTPRAAGLLGRVFADYGIALSARHELPLAQTPLGRALLGAARCALQGDEADGATPDDLLAYLRAPGMLRDPDVADALEAAVRRGVVTSLAGAREALGWELRELDSLAAAGRRGDPAPELRRLAGRLLAAPHRGRAAQLDRDEVLDAHAYTALATALDELAQLGPAGRLTGAELIDLIAGLPVGAGVPAAAGAVLLAQPAEIRARRFAAVFVCGLQEGEFPGPARDEPFFSDERRRELALASGLALRPREDALHAERYLFYAAVSRATERVFLSYRSSDEEGNLALASPFIDDVAAVLGGGWRASRRRRLLADVTWPADRAPTTREGRRAAAAARAPLTGDAPEPARRLGTAALTRVRHTRVVSAGALETYSDCPVRWLVDSQIAPAPLAPQPEPLARGSLIHGVLEALIAALGGPVTEASLPRAEQLLGRQITALHDDTSGALGSGVSDVQRAGALKAVEADVRRYLRHEAARGTHWTPLALEWRFGFQDEDERSLPALVLGEGDAAVRVRGVIDRIDEDGAGRAIVRDYKSGAPASNWPVARWGLDRRLQVALYMLVARRLAGLDVVAGVYQPLRGDDLRPRGAVREGVALGSEMHERDARAASALTAELDHAAQRATELAARLRAGDVTPCPATCSRTGCAHPAICRSQ
jgi:ATP-dependent helicase/DNAse subunit B